MITKPIEDATEDGRVPTEPGSRPTDRAQEVSAVPASIPRASMDKRRHTFRKVWTALFSEGHKTLAFEFAQAVGLEEAGDGWFMHDGGPCPVGASIKIKAVLWAEGGVHTWGIACRADDFNERQWRGIAAFQVFCREDYLAAQAIEARRAATGTGAVEDESAVGNADAPKDQGSRP